MSDLPTASAESATTAVSSNTTDQSQTDTGMRQVEDDKEPWKKVKHRYKAAGQDHEVDYDELVKRAEKGHGSEKRFQEAAQKEKDMKARLEKLKDPNEEDFEELIELIGFDKAKKFADKLVWDQIEWDKKTPEERERLQMQWERDQAKSELQKSKERQETAEKEQTRNQAMSIIQKELDAVLDLGKKEGLPAADIPEIQELIVDEMIAYLEYVEREEKAGREVKTPPPSHEDVLRKIQERYDSRSDVYVKRLSVEQLTKLLTKEQLSGLRQAEIDQLYAPIPKQSGPKQNQANIDPFERPSTSKKEDRVMRTEDFFKKMDKKYGR